MVSEIKTYKKRPECAIPGCTNEAFIHMAGQWVCGLCVKKWHDKQTEAKQKIDNVMFDEMKELNNGD